MLATAAVRTTLPETRSQRNYENSQTRARNAAVRAVLTDRRVVNGKRLTAGSKAFYVLLDQHYGWRNGLVCPKLRTLVLRFGLCRRSCQRWIAQLREFGYLVTEPRNGRACRHRLTWAQSVAPEAAPVSPLHLINANESNIEHAGVGVDSDTRDHRAAAPRRSGQMRRGVGCGGSPEISGDPRIETAPSPCNSGTPAPNSVCPLCHGTHYRTIVEWVRAGKQRHRIEKRVLCRCG